ncbi:hypothetical protein [Amnibacterium kyonggiense]|uniref:hypothetical protein n=1 Tax=Amnibacterium kyonggiense TaxID=595671 RepID=UPI00105F15A2|nr:hypothetical protein [Amnibacterium kyonggiense]
MLGAYGAIAITLGSVLAGCTPVVEGPGPASSPQSSAVFSSSKQAAAAAKAVYEKYLRIGEVVSESGGNDVDRFAPFLTKSALDAERKGAEELRRSKVRTFGMTELRKFQLQRADLKSGRVEAYACIDLSDVKVEDEDGKDVTPASRPSLQTLKPTFVWSGGHLLLEENGTWSGSSIC